MRLFYAPARTLEKEFVRYAAALQPGPGKRLLVLCPSRRVGKRLREELALQTGVCANVFFITFSQLLAQLDSQNAKEGLALLPGDNLHEYLLKKLLSLPAYNRYGASRGFVCALRSALRDMADGLVDPEVMEEYLQHTEQNYLRDDTAHWQWLCSVYRAYLEQTARVPGYRSYAQYFSSALTAVADSPYLHTFDEIIVYGFYELTGRQLEIFNMLRSHYLLTAFWLYGRHPAFAFGQKFFEANILGAAAEAVELPVDWGMRAAGEAVRELFGPHQAVNTPKGVHFVCAPDPEGEVFYAVKEMLRLHEEEGVPYRNMAVCARSLEPYKTLLPSVCTQNAVPLQAAFEFGFSAYPLGVFLLHLLSLRRGGFDREDVLAIVNSPYFKQKNTWRYLIKASLARRDFAQWESLLLPTLPGYDPEFLAWLHAARICLEQLEQAQDWTALAQAARQWLEINTDTAAFSPVEKDIWAQVQTCLDGFLRYAAVAPQAGAGEFLDELISALQGVRLVRRYDAAEGINALDALSVRGLGFEVVFLLGMNEKIFPQISAEDPVLRDEYRRILRDELGFWLNQKMERFEEERLLFFNAAEAGSQRVYLSYLRTDAQGKALVPSGYVAELARAARVDLMAQAQYVSSSLVGRLLHMPLKFLHAQEVSLLLAACQAAETDFAAAGLLDEASARSLQAAQAIAAKGSLGVYDGVVGPQCGQTIFDTQNSKGFSASSLQDLGKCPLKYFFAKGLGLKEPDEALNRDALSPDARGRAYHEVLMSFYQDLLKQGGPESLFESALRKKMDEALDAHYGEQDWRRFGIYPVVWRLILGDMRQKLQDFVVQDAVHLHGYVPSVFETDFEKVWQTADGLCVHLRGIVDRLDLRASTSSFRIIDYKSGKHGSKDLSADMLRRVILQPFIYWLLAQDQPVTQGLAVDGASLLSINNGYSRQELSAEGFERTKEKAAQLLQLLAEIIRRGEFFINPDKQHCAFCPYAAICRKDAFRPLLRARRASQAQRLAEAKS